jgi:hypothetical protein
MASPLHTRTLSLSLLASVLLSLSFPTFATETCTTQSQILPADRDVLTSATLALAASVQPGDAPILRTKLTPYLAKDPSALNNLVSTTAPKLKGATFTVEQLYLLDASQKKSTADADFYFAINRSPASTDFQIPSLPPGLYAFVILRADTQSPWRLSFLLLRDSQHSPQPWSIAGFYPKPFTAAGHDGVWYWTAARALAAQKQTWNAYLFYQLAQTLLQPAAFVSSTNLDKLRKELAACTPPALSEGISPSTPLVVKAADATEYRFTALTANDSLTPLSSPPDKLDLIVHLEADPPPPPPDSAAPKSKARPPAPPDPQTRNTKAMAALLAAYPELRTQFRTLWLFADTPGQNPVVTQQPLANIH